MRGLQVVLVLVALGCAPVFAQHVELGAFANYSQQNIPDAELRWW